MHFAEDHITHHKAGHRLFRGTPAAPNWRESYPNRTSAVIDVNLPDLDPSQPKLLSVLPTYPGLVALVGLVEPVLVEADDVGMVDGLQAVEDGRDARHVLLAVFVLREPNLSTRETVLTRRSSARSSCDIGATKTRTSFATCHEYIRIRQCMEAVPIRLQPCCSTPPEPTDGQLAYQQSVKRIQMSTIRIPHNIHSRALHIPFAPHSQPINPHCSLHNITLSFTDHPIRRRSGKPGEPAQ